MPLIGDLISTVLNQDGFRFYFYSNERNEPLTFMLPPREEKWNEYSGGKTKTYPAISSLAVSDDKITAVLSDDREISASIAWFQKWLNATQAQRKEFKISPGAYGVHWPAIDEDISVKAFLD